MTIQAIFIVDKKKNVLIFFGLLEKSVIINQNQLSNVLGTIVFKAVDLEINSISTVNLDERSYYFFGNFEKLVIILLIKDDVPPKEILLDLNKNFISHYSDLLENYSEENITGFKSFSEVLKEIIQKYHDKEQFKIGVEPIIEPMSDRKSFPEGISIQEKDEIFWNETKMIKDSYPTNFIEGFIFHLQIFLNVAPPTGYCKICINFFNYPLKPTIEINNDLKKCLGSNIEEFSFFYINWDSKKPPHIIEIIRELEVILIKFKEQGKLSEIDGVQKSAIPKLNPLPDIHLNSSS